MYCFCLYLWSSQTLTSNYELHITTVVFFLHVLHFKNHFLIYFYVLKFCRLFWTVLIINLRIFTWRFRDVFVRGSFWDKFVFIIVEQWRIPLPKTITERITWAPSSGIKYKLPITWDSMNSTKLLGAAVRGGWGGEEEEASLPQSLE